MKTEIETKTWALCPSCNGRVGTVDHLDIGSNAGPWFCDDCGAGWWLTRTVDGIEHRPHDHVKERTIVTLTLPPQRSEVVFALDGFRVVKAGERDPANDAYFYDEHTCPTNWLRDVTEVRFEGSDDPHGLWRWVSTRLATEGES